MTPFPHIGKRQKREEYRTIQQDQGSAELPQKKFYRQRAHANPFSDHKLKYPQRPAALDWSVYYTGWQPLNQQPLAQIPAQKVTIADIGCGFGGLLFALGPAFANEFILGLEIRTQVTEFVQDKIRALRIQNLSSSLYQNVACVRANTMKFLPNFFDKAQLSKMFFCFPDPHFKARKHKARIISSTINSEYAYVLRPGGIIYTITDVEDLHLWIVSHFSKHQSFERIPQDHHDSDPCVRIMMTETEEGKKVERNNGQKYVACFRRLDDPPWPVLNGEL